MVAKDRRPCSPRNRGRAAVGRRGRVGLDALAPSRLRAGGAGRAAPGAPAGARPRARRGRGAPARLRSGRWRPFSVPLGEDADLLRHAADRVAARLPGTVLLSGRGKAEPPLGGIPPRMPVLLPLPLRPLPARAPRPGLIGVLPLAAAAAERRFRRRSAAPSWPALGWRLGIGELDAAALRFVALAALQAAADLLLLRWSPALARQDGTRCAAPTRRRWC